MATSEKLNLTMLCDFYELTMGNGYFKRGYRTASAISMCSSVSVPTAAALPLRRVWSRSSSTSRTCILTRRTLHISGAGICSARIFWSIWPISASPATSGPSGGDAHLPQGADHHGPRPAIEAQLIETFLLLSINHQSLIATKANRVVRAAEGRTVLKFGSRRPRGAMRPFWGPRPISAAATARPAPSPTSSTACPPGHHGPCLGADVRQRVRGFQGLLRDLPTKTPSLLVDTYNTLRAAPDAIRAFNEVLKPMGITKCGIRLDSGDMAYLTQKARKMLDEAGWTECQITVSNSLDEYIIQDLLRQGAPDRYSSAWASGSSPPGQSPSLAACTSWPPWRMPDGNIQPKIKISENVGKITNPHFKNLPVLRQRHR